tara:strand:+ start:420 stop:623 length:204 start_codon:yes stop_codon:yes gene_type:complete
MNAQVLMITKMIMFMQEYVAEVQLEAEAEYAFEMGHFTTHGWCCEDCIIDALQLDNLPYIGIEPAIT